MIYNWIPYKLEMTADGPLIHWLDLGNRRIVEPFFDESISWNRMVMRQRSRYQSVTTIEVVHRWAAEMNYAAPCAFIFHVSRCGSTLLSQCLVEDTKHIVIPEAPLLDDILRLEDSAFPEGSSRQRLFNDTLKLLGQKRLNESLLFIKLDSWHLYQYTLLRSWYPDTYFYFLSREPKAIIRSHQKRRGIQMIPGYLPESCTKIKVQVEHYTNFDQFTADVLKGFYDHLMTIEAMQHPLDGFFDYNAGMDNMLKAFNNHIANRLENMELMQARTRQHSKNPKQPFEEPTLYWEDFPYRSCLSAYKNLVKIYEKR
ncbi:hypothetical protein [Sphingobacterium pedocola]|uniref:Sulfotransferase family protein n=1 Tax=Sphingobacterium pedocola TaxID=2082722 RepID=A0ABR9T1Q8_9SPHI|nr:hypothetical protein [Sphingobacterium pedocola]MBE8719263.1 hypothetical protein [Sphingobacterium pedocola]